MRTVHRHTISIRNNNGGGWVTNQEAQDAVNKWLENKTIEIININDLVYHSSLGIVIYYYDYKELEKSDAA